MPNWCSNSITITGDTNKIKLIKNVIEKGIPEDKRKDANVFMTLVGIPPDMNLHEYETKWYGTNIDNWGTKWDVSYDESYFEFGENQITLSPETAWSPPIGFAKSLAKNYGVKVEMYYEEPGCDFCGKTIITEDGTMTEEDYDFVHGKYVFDKESFWNEIINNIEFAKEDDVSLEDFMLDYDYVTEEDKKEIEKLYNES